MGVVLIPQGMAYSLIAGLPPIYGLYTSLVPLVVYALLGTSRQLSVGPTALASLLTAAAVAPLAGGDMERYLLLALALSFLAGIVQVILGVVRAGFVAEFLSRPVLAGFTSAAAMVIGLGQVKYLLGVQVASSDRLYVVMKSLVSALPDIHLPTVAIGVAALLLMIAFRKWQRTFPAAVAALVVGTLASWLFGFVEHGVSIVGVIPAGIPKPTSPFVSVDDIRQLVPGILTVVAIGVIETVAIGKYYAAKTGNAIDADKELIALGAAKIAGSFFQAFPNTGGFSRTAVNADAGAKTQIATIVAAAVVALVLMFFTPLFEFLPHAILGAIIVLAVSSLIDVKEIRYLWRVDRKDFALMGVTFVATATLGIGLGILVGVLASLTVVIHSSSRPHTAVMGRLPGTETFRNVERFPEAITEDGVVVLRFDASLFFANAGYVRTTIDRVVRESRDLRVLILDLYPVNDIDSTSVSSLFSQVMSLRERGIRVCFAGTKGPVRDRLRRAGIVDTVGAECFFHEVADASAAAVARVGKVGESQG